MASPLDFDYWVTQGERLGLKDEGLLTFANEKLAKEEKKEADRLAREDKKEADRLAREEKKEEERIARDLRVKERELHIKEQELEAEKQNRELERKRLELEQKRLEISGSGSGSGSTSADSSVIKMPKMPAYTDGDDITAYLIRFENLATLSSWPIDTWATRLALLFSGTSLNVYSTLPDDVIHDYAKLKSAILLAFKKTQDQYRKEFRYLKMSNTQNFSQYLTDMYRHFDYWMESAGISQTYGDLRDFMVADQFVTAIPNEIRIFLKENGIVKAKEMAEAADQYACAHKCYPGDKKPIKMKPQLEQKGDSKKSGVVKCFTCGVEGHVRNKCPKRALSEQKINICLDDENFNAPFGFGTINGSCVSTILRDTGCTCVVVSKELLPNIDPSQYPHCLLTDYLGRSDSFPVVKCYLSCKWYNGWVNAIIAPIKTCAVLLGNIKGAKCPTDNEIGNGSFSGSFDNGDRNSSDRNQFSEGNVHAVTRAMTRERVIHPLSVPDAEVLDMTHDEFKVTQDRCDSLKDIQEILKNEDTICKKNYSYKFVKSNDLVYQTILSSKNPSEVGKYLLVVPKVCIPSVLKLSHDAPVAGHFSHRKTLAKIRELFFWPRMSQDIYNYCRSCDVCQRTSSKGRVKKAKLVQMPICSVPFERVAIDIVGPISPCSSDGHRYILTLIDYATSFPEAVPLRNITSIDVSEALLSIFSRVGIPKEIISDRGAQFTSDLMGKVNELIGVKPIFTTPYHPMANGRIERQHSILKSILRKLCSTKPKDWHRYLPCALFAMREVPSDTLGFSPFVLLYGKQGRGPLAILHDLWTNPELNNDTLSSYKFLIDLRERLEETAEIAATNQSQAMHKYKSYFDIKSSNRSLKVGDEILVLLPDNSNKLLTTWQGPYKVLKVLNKVDYLVDVKGKEKLYHINLLKKYIRRSTICLNVADESIGNKYLSSPVVNVCVLDSSEGIITVPKNKEKVLNICPELSNQQKNELNTLLIKYDEVFSELPGCTDTLMHKISLVTDEPIRSRVYPVPVHLREDFNKEVDRLIELGIIEPSQSPYCSPVVMIKKPDNSYRLAQDFRALNSITKFDAEPMPNIEDDLFKFNNAFFISELDVTKAYHQVKLDQGSKKYTAFPTYKGLMQYTRMPFGLVTACATYIRLMRKVFDKVNNVSVYFDNIYVISKEWKDHLLTLELVLERLKLHGLTARPSKCNFAFPSVRYLGFSIKNNEISPLPEKVDHISSLSCPRSKKLLRSFLGTINFYRKFIPDMAKLAFPLTEKLKKDVKEPLEWNPEDIECFDMLKSIFSSDLILRLPDISLPFCLRTDASVTGLGAVLLQYHDKFPYPVSYASRKLLPREQNYSTIERECLAIKWGIERFKYYLYGRPFILETDHKPLLYLDSVKDHNKRVLRWALALQPFKFQVTYIPGTQNHFPDLLSRAD